MQPSARIVFRLEEAPVRYDPRSLEASINVFSGVDRGANPKPLKEAPRGTA